MQIFVETKSGKTITLQLKGSDSVLKIKESIQKEEGLAPEKQRLTAGGVKLDDHCSLSDYDMEEGSTIYLGSRCVLQKDHHLTEVDVQVNGSGSFRFETEVYTTIKDLKDMIHDETSMPVDEQHVFVPLNDNTLVSDTHARFFVMYWFKIPSKWDQEMQFHNQFMITGIVFFAYALGFLCAILPALIPRWLWS